MRCRAACRGRVLPRKTHSSVSRGALLPPFAPDERRHHLALLVLAKFLRGRDVRVAKITGDGLLPRHGQEQLRRLVRAHTARRLNRKLEGVAADVRPRDDGMEDLAALERPADGLDTAKERLPKAAL